MDAQINSEDYRCPCCMNYVYINFQCNNKHNICENCYMKMRKCPICRDEKITKSICNNNITRKECKNKECNLELFYFDDEHEVECLYNPFHCKFCNMDMAMNDFEHIKSHYDFNCVNIFKYIEYNENKEEEIEGRKYYLRSIDLVPSLINIENQYQIILIPKISQNRIDLYLFSTNNKYKLSNYKVKIFSQSGNLSFESIIHYNKMYYTSILLDDICVQNKSLNFIIQNMFIINRKVIKEKIDNVTYFESNFVEGEPGSAGNWSYEDLEEMTNRFSNIFRNK